MGQRKEAPFTKLPRTGYGNAVGKGNLSGFRKREPHNKKF